jgi:hypothetical protein
MQVVTRLMLIFLCAGILVTVTECYVAPTSYGTSSYGGGADYERRQYRKQWGEATYHPWERSGGYSSLNE